MTTFGFKQFTSLVTKSLFRKKPPLPLNERLEKHLIISRQVMTGLITISTFLVMLNAAVGFKLISDYWVLKKATPPGRYLEVQTEQPVPAPGQPQPTLTPMIEEQLPRPVVPAIIIYRI